MRILRVCCLCVILLAAAMSSVAELPATTPVLTLKDAAAKDQDDMCIWVHPENPALSAIITSDKAAAKLFVYDLEGTTLQEIPVDGKPGNIDLRTGFPLGGKKVDIVAFNERDHSAIHVYGIEVQSRKLTRIDDGAIKTGPNYGFTLYRSPKSGKFYAFTVAEEDGDGAEQYELSDDGNGKITGTKVRAWDLGHSEGCVADDVTGQLYIAEERRGIWKLGAEPGDPVPGELIISLGAHDFVADAEGMAILYGPDGTGYLLVSSQGNNQFKVYRREAPHEFVASFQVEGVEQTDGIDVLRVNLGPAFPNGVFTCHNGKTGPYPVHVCDLARLEAIIGGKQGGGE